jgi:hypothetical protein
MRRAKAIILLLTLAAGLQAQELRNSGAHIVLTNDTHLVIQGSYINQEGGLLHQDGTVWLTGDFTNNSTTNALASPDGSDSIRLNGTSPQTIGGTYTGVHILEGISVEAGSTLEMPCGTQVTLMGNLTAGGSFALKANGDRTIASLIVKGDIHNEGGTVGFERWVPAASFEYFASPIIGQTASVFAPLGSGPPSNGLFAYDVTNDTWAATITVEATPIVVMQGYAFIANAASTIAFSGDAYFNGEQSIALTKSAKTGFNLVGNPYPSAIDWKTSEGWSRENLSDVVWINYANTPGDGNFASFNNLTPETAINWLGNVGSDLGIIAPTQAFWVYTNANTTLTVNSAAQAHSANTVNKKSASENPLIRLQAQRSGYSDEMVIYFHNEATEGLDRFDTRKKLGSGAYPQIYAPVADAMTAVNTLPQSLLSERVVMPITLKSDMAGSITIALTELKNLGDDMNVILTDKSTGTQTDLRTAAYTVEVESNSTLTNRLEVTLERKNTTSTPAIDKSTVNIYASAKNIYVGMAHQGSRVEVYNAIGVQMLSHTLNGSAVENIPTNLAKGVYIVVVNGSEGRTVKRVFIQ